MHCSDCVVLCFHGHRMWNAVQVWDYASDGYVHRLVQSKTDGKLVEVPSPAQAAFGERQPTAGLE